MNRDSVDSATDGFTAETYTSSPSLLDATRGGSLKGLQQYFTSPSAASFIQSVVNPNAAAYVRSVHPRPLPLLLRRGRNAIRRKRGAMITTYD